VMNSCRLNCPNCISAPASQHRRWQTRAVPVEMESARGKLGLPPPLWGRVGEGGDAFGNTGASIAPPPPPTPPRRKSGLPNLRTIIRNPGKPGLRGRGVHRERGTVLRKSERNAH
jgi:hypothetical protein